MKIIFALTLFILSGSAFAQSAVVVATCGSITYSAGQAKPPTQDIAGNACVNASGSSSGGGTVVSGSGTAGTPAPGVVTTQNTANGVGADAIGNNIVVGPGASGATAIGNPVPVAAKYNATLPTFLDGQRGDIQIGSRGSLSVSLFGANATAAAGIGQPSDAFTPANALDVNSQNMVFDGSNYVRTRSGGIAGMAGVSWQASPSGAYTYTHIATSATTIVKSGTGTLHSITINMLGTVASTITVYDNTAGSGTVIAVINSLSVTGTLTYDVAFTTGLTIVSTGTIAPDVTVSYK